MTDDTGERSGFGPFQFPTDGAGTMRRHLVRAALENWQALNENLTQLTEDELKSALNTERSHDRRKHFVTRIHARGAKLRAKREREELLAVCK